MRNPQLEKDLREALTRHELRLYYQPKMDLITGKITGTEALIRWEHPEKGFVSPAEFIPLAEETDLILSIGEWVLQTACSQNKVWQEIGLPPMIMAVNLSGRQFYQSDLVERIQHILDETKLAPENLELEITENMIMDVDHVLPILNELKRMGVRISLDDFGTGYSSLYYLNKLPIDVIKIDQSFVRNCTEDTKDATIIKAIIAMAHQLKMDVIAEGIETRDHLIFLQQNLCNKGQGYFFSKPLPPDELVVRWAQTSETIQREGIPQEVSREKWLEDELENTRQELRDTIRQQKGMTFKFIERNGRFIHTLCDGELVYRLGLTPEQIVGKELTEFLSVPYAAGKIQYYRRAWAGEENVTYEGKNNDVYYVASLRPIRKGGQVVEVIGSCVDITARVQKEQEVSVLTNRLAEREAKYRLIAENSQDLIAILDRNGNLQYASPSHERVFGERFSSFQGNSVFCMVHPDDLSHIRECWDEMMFTKTSVRIEWRFVKSDGSCIWLEAIGTPIRTSDGEIDSVLVTGREITDRKAQEEKLLQSENRYRALVELLPDAILVHIDGRIVYANRSSVELLAAKKVNDVIGQSLLDFVHPIDRESTLKRIKHGMSAEGNSSGLVEARYIRFDGLTIDIEAKGVGILYEGKHAVQVLVRDITERKKMERSMMEEKEKLESLLNNSQDAVHIMDLEGQILRVNPAWESMYGWTQEEVVGKLIPIVSQERFDNTWNQIMERIIRGDTIPPYEITVSRKGGERFYAFTSIYPINTADGKVVAVVGSTRDITARKELERNWRIASITPVR